MKKLIVVAAATVLGTPAFAQGTVLGSPQFQSYSNHGQCESALAAERNRQRANPSQRGAGYQDLSGSEFNRASRSTTRCEARNGQHVVVYYQNGAPR